MLAGRLRAGDRQAFAPVYQRYKADVLALAGATLGSFGQQAACRPATVWQNHAASGTAMALPWHRCQIHLPRQGASSTNGKSMMLLATAATNVPGTTVAYEAYQDHIAGG